MKNFYVPSKTLNPTKTYDKAERDGMLAFISRPSTKPSKGPDEHKTVVRLIRTVESTK